MIDLNLTLEQTQIIESARAMLARIYPVSRLHDDARPRDDLGAIAEFGGFSLSLAENAGGMGLSAVEDVLLHIELGRHLVSPSAISTALALRLCHETGHEDLVNAIIAGEKKVCLGNALSMDLEALAGLSAGSGMPAHIFDADDAEFAVIVLGRQAVLVDLTAITLEPVAPADHTIHLARADISVDAVRIVAGPKSSVPPMARLLLSAQLLGMAESARDLSVDYAKVRTQFGQPIGAFQAIKHRCANMAIQADVLSAQLTFAAIAVRDNWPDVDFQVDAAWLLACRTALENTRGSIQVHGGIGFTAECDAHFYLLRAHLYENIGGNNAMRIEALGRQNTSVEA